MKEKWSDAAWRAAGKVYEDILRHPFVTELASGELDRERFRMEWLFWDSAYNLEQWKI